MEFSFFTQFFLSQSLSESKGPETTTNLNEVFINHRSDNCILPRLLSTDDEYDSWLRSCVNAVRDKKHQDSHSIEIDSIVSFQYSATDVPWILLKFGVLYYQVS